MSEKNSKQQRIGKEHPRSVVDRRSGIDTRKEGPERRSGLERRRGPGRRLSEERKAAEEGHMTDEQFEFIKAIDEYKRNNDRPFPTWTEVLEVIKAIGYRKIAEPQPLGSEKWKRAQAPE